MDPVTRIGERIAECREKAGLSQSGLARIIGTSQSAVSMIESGERNPSYAMLYKIAPALGLGLDTLVRGTHP